MDLTALKPLAVMRMAGELPAGSVWLYLGEFDQPRWWIWRGGAVEVVVQPDTPMERLDLRPLVGLRVCVLAATHNRALLRLCARIKEFAAGLDVFVLDWLPDCLGMRWDRGQTEDWMPTGVSHKEAV